VSTVAGHYDAGKLAEAVAAATAAVKSAPTDARARWVLGELLIVAGELERADQQFDTLGTLDAKMVPRVSPVRYLIRAAVARRDFQESGAVPEFIDGGPTPHQRLLLEAGVHLRAGDSEKALTLASEAERIRPALAGRHGETAFTDFRDGDDLLAGVFEVFKGGKYFWIPAERVVAIEFDPPSSPLDLYARAVTLTLGSAGEEADHEVHMPVVYALQSDSDDLCRLARSTKWVGGRDAPVRGVGQRIFSLADGTDLDILDIESLAFTTES